MTIDQTYNSIEQHVQRARAELCVALQDLTDAVLAVPAPTTGNLNRAYDLWAEIKKVEDICATLCLSVAARACHLLPLVEERKHDY